MLNTLLSLLILFSVKESKIAVSCPFGKEPGEVGIMHEYMQYGPSDFEVDWEENIYVLDTYNNKRIMKFDSTGKFLFTITVPESIEPNNLLADTKNNLFVFGVSHNKFVVAKYSSEGKLLKVFPAPPASLMSDLKGKIYAEGEHFVFVYDEELNYLGALNESQFKNSRHRCYAQWTDWITYKLTKDEETGKYNMGLKNLTTKQEIVLKLPPGRITYGYVEGIDKDGNVYSAGHDPAALGRVFFRISPIMHTIDTLRVEHKCGGDLAHAIFISPNGEIYQASIVYEANKPKWYRIYRYSKNLFARME
jgi:hypothetical protein